MKESEYWRREIRNKNAHRKCLGCRDVYRKFLNNLNYKSWLNLLTKKIGKENSYKKITRHNELRIK